MLVRATTTSCSSKEVESSNQSIDMWIRFNPQRVTDLCWSSMSTLGLLGDSRYIQHLFLELCIWGILSKDSLTSFSRADPLSLGTPAQGRGSFTGIRLRKPTQRPSCSWAR